MQPEPLRFDFAVTVAAGLTRPVAFGESSSAKPVAFQSLNADTIALTLEVSRVTPAGLVTFQASVPVLPGCLTSVYASLSRATVTSVISPSLRLQMVLSLKSMGRLLMRSRLYFLTR